MASVQVLEKKKELQRRLAQADAEASSYADLKETISKLERRCQHLQVSQLFPEARKCADMQS